MRPGQLRALAFRFREARTLFAAVELGVFAALGSELRSAEELACELRLDPRAAEILLEALAAIGALSREGASYAIAAELRGTLVPGNDDYVGNLLLHDLWHWSSWARLESAVRDGAAWTRRDGDPHLGDPEVLRRFLPNYALAMEQSDGGASRKLAQRIAPLAPRRVLDLGGGSGGLLEAILERLPDARGTLVEHAFSLARAKELSPSSEARSRIEFVALDFEKQEIPPGHDLIVLSRVLMGMSPHRARELLARVTRALEPGGALVVHDFDAASRVGALLSLDMLLHTGGGVHSGAALGRWLGELGLELESERRLLPYTRAWTARKALPVTESEP